ncbi:hypothetical protein PR003_g25366 [Phytophthora rubi]|uniref:BED-type domain-containing protein n=1 Tax=Phytophthora rubi TaxID=129364 RepID=A0A6A3KHV0_9STRA|nr:hypothetical protein PR001_g17468 [Phytophthora rubi]KAE9290149.1 hypothetical protein PR003_g25366 [Phytophthora rubi]
MQITKKSGRKRDEACNEVDVDADGYVYCLRCEGVDHKLEFTHVDRVKRHLRETCAKRPRQEVVTTYLPPQIDTATQNLFDKMFALWLFSTGMAFYKVQHENFVAVSRLLPPSVKIPSQHLIRTRLLDECHEDSPVRMRGALARRFYSLVTDRWTDTNGFAVINCLAICGQHTFVWSLCTSVTLVTMLYFWLGTSSVS